MNKCIALLLLATGAPAFADDARPFVHSPRGPGVDHGALSLGASAFFDDDGVLPYARVAYTRGLSRSWDLVVEADTMGLATVALAGVRLKGGEKIVIGAGMQAGGGLVIMPDFFGKDVVAGMALGVPSLSLGFAGEGVAFTLKGEAIIGVRAEPVVAPRATAALEIGVGSGAIAIEGGLLIVPDENAYLPTLAVGWTF